MDARAKRGHWLVAWVVLAAAILFAVAGVNAPKAYAEQTGSITLVACTAPANANSSTILPGQVTPVAGDVFTLQKLSDEPGAANADVAKVNVDSTPLATFPVQTKTSGADGTVVFSDLSSGVYLVTQAAPTGYRAAEQKFMVAIPMADSTAASGANWNMKVYPKLQADKMISKEVSEAPAVAGVGSVASWTIHVTIPQDMKYIDAYGKTTYSTDWAIYDDLDAALDYLGADSTSSNYQASKLEVLDASGASLATLASGTDYTEAYDAAANRVTWTLTTDGIKKIADANGGAQIAATVHTVVNEKAYDISTYIFNNAGYTYKDPHGDSHSGKVTPGTPDPNNPDDPHIAIGGLVINKYLSGTDTKLAGAHFKVATSEENAKNGKYLTRTTDDKAADIELVTDADGAASLGGLASGTYWLVETQAPTAKDASGNTVNCVLPTDPFQVTVGSDNTTKVVTASIANKVSSSTSSTSTRVTTGGGTNGNGGGSGISNVVSSVTNGVKTGDPMTWSILLSIIAVAVIGCVITARKRREQHESEKPEYR